MSLIDFLTNKTNGEILKAEEDISGIDEIIKNQQSELELRGDGEFESITSSFFIITNLDIEKLIDEYYIDLGFNIVNDDFPNIGAISYKEYQKNEDIVSVAITNLNSSYLITKTNYIFTPYDQKLTDFLVDAKPWERPIANKLYKLGKEYPISSYTDIFENVVNMTIAVAISNKRDFIYGDDSPDGGARVEFVGKAYEILRPAIDNYLKEHGDMFKISQKLMSVTTEKIIGSFYLGQGADISNLLNRNNQIRNEWRIKNN